MADFLFNAVPHDEAVDFIASKPAVSKAVFNRLLPELRSRAFVISGIDAASAVQAIRDRIAELPAGATWDAVKKDIARQISVHFIDPDADAEERDKQVNASNRRAELLLRTHGFQAYQAASFSRMNEQRDVLPYWQYITMGDGRVRPAHAALNGVVVPASSPFWHTHFPPWDYGCRCQAVPLSKEDHDDIQAADAALPAEKQRVMDGPLLKELELNNRLVRGPSEIANVSPPSGPGAYHWHPGDRDLTVADLRARYDNVIFGDFEKWAQKTEITPGQSVWQWIDGQVQPPAPSGPGGQLAVVPPPPLPGVSPAPVPTPSASRPASVADALKLAGLDLAANATPLMMDSLRDLLVQDAPASASTALKSIQGAAGYKNISEAHLSSLAQGFINMLPPAFVGTQLPAFDLVVRPSLAGALGQYTEARQLLELDGGILDRDAAGLKKTFWHEMIHWAHDHGPAEFKARVAALFAARTANFTEPVVKLKPWNSAKTTGYEDDFLDANGDEYAGRVYPWETAAPGGLEIATHHLEKLALSPVEMARHWNHKSLKTGNYAWREAFVECLHMFFLPPALPAP